ncbi:MAG: putative peptidoglycan glycosyltransferase FtsW [Patescibacteria group bacterium]
MSASIQRQNKKRPDYYLLGSAAALVAVGLLFLASISVSFSQKRFDNPFYFLWHQIGLGLMPGIVLGVLAYRLPLTFFKKWSWLIVLFNIFLLGLVFVPKIGLDLGGASRWLHLGPVSFQPTELLKLTFILYLASWLASRKEKSGRGKTFLAFLFVLGVVAAFLIAQPDISTLGIIVLTALAMYFLSGAPLWHVILMICGGVSALAILIKSAGYRSQRWTVFLKSFFLRSDGDPLGIGYQVQQAIVSIGSGGLFGLGLGMSQQKFGNLPFPMSDSVFAVMGEEIGFAGCSLIIIIFLIFIVRGFMITKRAPDIFCGLLAAGISFWLGIQAFVNIAAMMGLLPLTGIPLPLISYGGSALTAELAGIGILLNVSRHI